MNTYTIYLHSMYVPKSEAELRAAKLMYYFYVILGIKQLDFYSACSITLTQLKLPSDQWLS
jgi:hypothetical protein